MKNTIVSALAAAILAAVLISFFARAADYQSMTDEELLAEANAIRSEQLERRFALEDKTILLDQDGAQVYLTGDRRFSHGIYCLEVVVINNSDYTIQILIDNVSVNGWQCSGTGTTKIEPGNRLMGELRFNVTKTDIISEEDLSDLHFALVLYDSVNHERISITEPITMFISES